MLLPPGGERHRVSVFPHRAAHTASAHPAGSMLASQGMMTDDEDDVLLGLPAPPEDFIGRSIPQYQLLQVKSSSSDPSCLCVCELFVPFSSLSLTDRLLLVL